MEPNVSLEAIDIVAIVDNRRVLARQLRTALARYRGGRFETGASGGAGGMVFYIDPAGRRFYIGGFNPADAERIVSALNLTLTLLSTKDSP